MHREIASVCVRTRKERSCRRSKEGGEGSAPKQDPFVNRMSAGCEIDQVSQKFDWKKFKMGRSVRVPKRQQIQMMRESASLCLLADFSR